MDALTEAIVRLLKRMEQVEARLGRLERLSSAGASPEPSPPAESQIPPVVQPPQASQQPATSEPTIEAQQIQLTPSTRDSAFDRRAEHRTEVREERQLEARVGLTWVNRIGVLTLVIGVALFFKYAFDNQWIGQTGRVVLGVLAGLATLLMGDVLWRRGQKVFAQGVCGLAMSILYLSFYASFGFYHLLPGAAAFALMAMVTATSGALALRYDSMAIGALAMLGGYLTPLLLSTGQDAPWSFFSYVFVIDVGAVAMSRPRRWRPLDVMAFVASAALYALWFVAWFTPEKRTVATVAVLGFYALFAVLKSPPISGAAQALTGIALAAIWPQTAPYLFLALAVGAAGLALADWAGTSIATLSFATFWGSYGLWIGLHGRPEETIAALCLTAAFVMYLAWVAFEVLVRGQQVRTQHLVILGFNGITDFGCIYVLLKPHYEAWLGLIAVAIAAVHLLAGMSLWRARAAASYDSRPLLLVLGLALGFLTLAVPIQFTGFSITLSWALEAAALVWIGRRVSDNRVWMGAAAIYVLVVLRLYAFDAWLPETRLLVNSRFVTFAVSAASFWLAAWFVKSTRSAAAIAYVTGHFIFLSACLFELNDWAQANVSADNHVSVLAVGVSILMAVYGTLLICIGVIYRLPLDRVLGLGLMGIVVLKLYLYDVWEASRLFRTAAFVSLGVLLLFTSYLYSRFRVALENWWKDEDVRR